MSDFRAMHGAVSLKQLGGFEFLHFLDEFPRHAWRGLIEAAEVSFFQCDFAAFPRHAWRGLIEANAHADQWAKQHPISAPCMARSH